MIPFRQKFSVFVTSWTLLSLLVLSLSFRLSLALCLIALSCRNTLLLSWVHKKIITNKNKQFNYLFE